MDRRSFLGIGLASAASAGRSADALPANVHQQLLDLAAKFEALRRNRFTAVKTNVDLTALQASLRDTFLKLIGGLLEPKGPPPAKVVATIDADGYRIEKLAFESFPGYFVPVLLYLPTGVSGPTPGIVSPCGHSAVGKAAPQYQTLHVNLAKRGFVVLTYDPVGQGERSQFWDAKLEKSRFNLTCGEHAVLGNPLYLLGSSLARYRIADGMRAIDYLTKRPEVDPNRIGCVGNSGGGTLTAYVTALDRRVTAAAIGCYITSLPRRMGNRIQQDPDADPEQDVFGFVSEGIDHAGLLALCAPRPTLVCSAKQDFFPIEGARATVAEAKHLYDIAGVGERISQVVADEKHGLTLPLRTAVYRWFDRWLADRTTHPPAGEVAVTPRPAKELAVCPTGQVNRAYWSRQLLPLAWKEFGTRKKTPRVPLLDLLGPDPELADYRLTEVTAGAASNRTVVACVNGNEAKPWQEEKEFLRALERSGLAVVVIDPRGVGALRPKLAVYGHDYADPLSGVEENVAYNAFLVGKSLLGMRVADVSAAIKKLSGTPLARVVLCGRGDAALVACLTAAVDPAVTRLAVEGLLLSFVPLFDGVGRLFNAASILPALLRDFGDVTDVLAEIAPRKTLVAAGVGELPRRPASVEVTDRRFVTEPRSFLDWLAATDR
jgi:hypothetical protein